LLLPEPLPLLPFFFINPPPALLLSLYGTVNFFLRVGFLSCVNVESFGIVCGYGGGAPVATPRIFIFCPKTVRCAKLMAVRPLSSSSLKLEPPCWL
jgi:hypothetical protein